MSMSLAASLRTKLKLQDNDIVAIILPNVPEYPCALLGVMQAGCIATTANPAYNSDEIQRQLEMVKVKAVIASNFSYPRIVQALKNMKKNVPVILIDNEVPEGAIKFAELAEDLNIDINCLKSIQRSSNDVAVIPFSSGTTGLPKGVVLTHGNIVSTGQAISLSEVVAIEETTETYQAVLPAVLPFFHIFGLSIVMLNQMYMGVKLVTMPMFKPELFLEVLVKYKASCLFCVPPMAVFLGKHPAVSPQHLQYLENMICGAAPLAETDVQALSAKNKNIIIRQGFGLTETGGAATIGHRRDTNHASVGHTLSCSEIKIADLNTGEALGPGQEGEIWVRGSNVMRGYFDNPEANAETFSPGGWFKTGDIGRYDDGKYLYITDRLKELIKVKGFQVPPAELEALLRTHPKVLDCAVIGIPDTIQGEVPKAFLVPQPGQSVSTEEVKEYVNAKVTSYKKIKEVQLVDSIPKNPAGKILRKELKQKYS
ncbi:Probable 4-coumarate--CoA ligase 3 [Eumeta japonica]|uniref:Probable 4-coumarate--CoA ligase 3 n=1 Tax=Eumeta variegata TaxID=151549 RepID=A0A4C1ZH29_EUMVA|nr:Probable 4-coumarate--CoA ligase 3 [Eumeta japonica]